MRASYSSASASSRYFRPLALIFDDGGDDTAVLAGLFDIKVQYFARPTTIPRARDAETGTKAKASINKREVEVNGYP